MPTRAGSGAREMGVWVQGHRLTAARPGAAVPSVDQGQSARPTGVNAGLRAEAPRAGLVLRVDVRADLLPLCLLGAVRLHGFRALVPVATSRSPRPSPA